jgi:hypothetical protein
MSFSYLKQQILFLRRCRSSRVVDKKRMIGKKWRADVEERHKRLLIPPPQGTKLHFIPQG